MLIWGFLLLVIEHYLVALGDASFVDYIDKMKLKSIISFHDIFMISILYISLYFIVILYCSCEIHTLCIQFFCIISQRFCLTISLIICMKFTLDVEFNSKSVDPKCFHFLCQIVAALCDRMFKHSPWSSMFLPLWVAIFKMKYLLTKH